MDKKNSTVEIRVSTKFQVYPYIYTNVVDWYFDDATAAPRFYVKWRRSDGDLVTSIIPQSDITIISIIEEDTNET